MEIDRRKFFRVTTGALTRAAVGAAVGSAAVIPVRTVSSQVEARTGKSTAAADINQRAREVCGDPIDRDCIIDRVNSPEYIRSTVIEAPIKEAFYQLVPSIALSLWEREPIETPLVGTGGFKFSRREGLFGLVSAAWFGLDHMFTRNNKFDTNVIPAPQTLMGFVYWGLGRKFGALSSVIAHGAFNAWDVYRLRRR